MFFQTHSSGRPSVCLLLLNLCVCASRSRVFESRTSLALAFVCFTRWTQRRALKQISALVLCVQFSFAHSLTQVMNDSSAPRARIWKRFVHCVSLCSSHLRCHSHWPPPLIGVNVTRFMNSHSQWQCSRFTVFAFARSFVRALVRTEFAPTCISCLSPSSCCPLFLLDAQFCRFSFVVVV